MATCLHKPLLNGLRLSNVPPELSCLNALEIRLISLRVPFMKMVALPSGKQICVHGPAVNVPSKLDSVCTVLPRLPSQSELIPLKLKRKLAYKGRYMYDYVTPEKFLNALRWLKLHNPLYANVEINEEWVLDAEIDDHDLYASLTSSTDSDPDTSNHVESTEVAMDIDMNSEFSNCISNSEYSNDVSNSCPVTTVVSTEVAVNVDKSYESENNISDSEPNIDSVDPASHACSDPNSTNDLETAKHNLETYATDNNFTIRNVPGDGNCLYNSVLYQLESKGIISTTVENLRQMVASYLEEHANLYMPFVVSPIASDNPYNNDTETLDAMDAFISSMSDPETSSLLAYERYIERVRSDSWGDHVVITALANMFHVTINVVHARQHDCTVSITPPVDSHSNCELNLGLVNTTL